MSHIARESLEFLIISTWTLVIPRSGLHPHDLVTAVHVEDLAGDGGGAVGGEEGAGSAEFFAGDVAFERRMGFVMLEHIGEAGNAAGGQGVYRAGTDAIHADFLRTKIVSKVAGGSFEGCLGHTHHVVVRDDFFGAV